MTLYGAGLRIAEALHLRVPDIDSARGIIRIRHGKGDVERQAMLSPVLLDALRAYGRVHRPADWLFPGRDPSRPLHERSVQRAISEHPVRPALSGGLIHAARCRCEPALPRRPHRLLRHPPHLGADPRPSSAPALRRARRGARSRRAYLGPVQARLLPSRVSAALAWSLNGSPAAVLPMKNGALAVPFGTRSAASHCHFSASPGLLEAPSP
jgi:hypothetical protein